MRGKVFALHTLQRDSVTFYLYHTNEENRDCVDMATSSDSDAMRDGTQ